MHDETRSRKVRTAFGAAYSGICALTLGAAIFMSAEYRMAQAETASIHRVDERRPGIAPGSRRPGLGQTMPETKRDQQRPGYRPGYRPGVFERHYSHDCRNRAQPRSSNCR
jgi:hypothetical protein